VRKLVLAVLIAGAGAGSAATWVLTDQAGKTDVTKLSALAQQVALAFDRDAKDAKTAAQVSQLADEAGVVLRYIEIRQQEEVIRLLRKLAGE
jgi:hypothetical protein